MKKSEKVKLISISGSVANGKSTFGSFLEKELDRSKFFKEDVSENLYLSDFYNDMEKWSFHSRISFLAMKAKLQKEFDYKYDYIIYDRCLQELITFAELQFNMGSLSERDYKTFLSLYQSLEFLLPEIDYIVYLYCSPSKSIERIKERNRFFELKIDIDYLEKVQLQYEKWLNKFDKKKIIRINTTEIKVDDYSRIAKSIADIIIV